MAIFFCLASLGYLNLNLVSRKCIKDKEILGYYRQMGNFRIQSRFILLTYKSWININDLKKQINKKTKGKTYKLKVAHEIGDENHNYKHTHVLLVINKKIDWKNERCLDIGDIHPQFKKILTAQHFVNSFNYLDKENCVLDDLDGNEFPTSGHSELRYMILAHTNWFNVCNDVNIIENKLFIRCMKWAKLVFDSKPKVNLTKDLVLYPWQMEVLDILLKQDNRTILWIYDNIGGNGKTILGNYLIDHYNAGCVNSGNLKDIAYYFDYQEIMVFDLPRSNLDGFTDYSPYRTMECLKDGRIFSSKYESKLKRFKSCKVVVFSNFLPSISKLSRDRWDIRTLKDLEISGTMDISGIS